MTPGGKSLDGLRVLVTRERQAALGFAERLSAAGAISVACPAIEIVICNPPGFDAALAHLEQFDWLVLTSRNAVRAIACRLEAQGRVLPVAQSGLRTAVVGKATEAALLELGCQATLVADPANAENLSERLVATGLAGSRVLFPASRIARPTLPGRLRAAGAVVAQFPVYDAVAPVDLHVPPATEVDVLTFASPSAVYNVVDAAGRDYLTALPVVCIGETTGDAAREAGARQVLVAEQATSDGMIEALARCIQTRKEVRTNGAS